MHSAQSAKSVQPVKPAPRSPHPDRHANVDDLYPYTDGQLRNWDEEREVMEELAYRGIKLNTD